MGNTNSQEKKDSVYILKLENDKYYVGRTSKPVAERFNEHLIGKGSAWTELHKPKEIVKIIKNPDDFDEDKQTKIYMRQYGINNVRGGSYVTIELPEFQIKSLEQELCTSNNKCFKCHGEGHYATQCIAKDIVAIAPAKPSEENTMQKIVNVIEEIANNMNEDESGSDSESDSNKDVSKCPKKLCRRCGRTSHWEAKCYAKRHINGKWLNTKKIDK